jgi:hypothetical protein
MELSVLPGVAVGGIAVSAEEECGRPPRVSYTCKREEACPPVVLFSDAWRRSTPDDIRIISPVPYL